MFPESLLELASAVLGAARAKGLQIATAESCTGGLLAAILTEIPGASHVLERGFVTYSNSSKTALLGVSHQLIESEGAVSEAVARSMAKGALAHSQAELAVSVTGIAGPEGGSERKPVGLVHFALASQHGPEVHEAHRFGEIGRTAIRLKSAEMALQLLHRSIQRAS